jgi:tetratricopeptide (TPR) repeat protein
MLIRRLIAARLRTKLCIAAALALCAWLCAPVVFFQLANTLWKMSPDTAEGLSEDAIVWSGGHYPAAQVLRARLLLSRDRVDEAVGSWLTIRQEVARPVSASLELAREALLRRQFRFALEIASRLAEQSPSNADVAEFLVQAHTVTGNTQAAAISAETLTKLRPMSPVAWKLRMESLQRLQQVTGAIAAGEKAATLNPTPDDGLRIHRSLSELTLSTADTKAATAHCKWVLNHANEPQPLDYIRLAYALRQAGDTTQAIDAVEKALNIDSRFMQGLMLRGFLHFDSGSYDKAAVDLERVLQTHPAHKETIYKLARCLLRLGRDDEAEIYLKRSRELHEQSVKLPASE